MRVLFMTFAAVLLFGVAAPAAGAQIELRGIVPLAYDYDVSWRPHARELSGTGRIKVVNRSAESTRWVWIRLRPNDGDGLERIRPWQAQLDRRAAGGSMVRLRTDEPIREGASRSIGFHLSLRVPKANTSLGRSKGADLFGDALPIVAIAGERGIRFGAEPDYGEGTLHPVADWNVAVVVPRGLRAVLPGHATSWDLGGSKPGRIHVSENFSARDFAFAIGRFRCASGRAETVRFRVCGVRESRRVLQAALARTERAWSAMQRWYGGYVLPNLKVIVGDLPFGGSEYPGLVFSTPDNATIAHEVAHQWFYGIVGNDQYADPFLDESLTAYAEQQFHHSYHCNLSSPVRNPRRGLGIGMGYWQRHLKAYEDTIYRGGACALTLLRRDLGETAFQSALRTYVQANANKIADIGDFLSAVHAAAPNYDLDRWKRLVGLE